MESVTDNFVIDGGHNEDGIAAFLESVKRDGAGHRNLLYSAVSDKNIEGVAGLIIGSGLFDSIVLCRIASYRAADRERLMKAFEGGVKVCWEDSVSEGIKSLLNDENCDMHYAVGSLYLVGEIKALALEGIHND